MSSSPDRAADASGGDAEGSGAAVRPPEQTQPREESRRGGLSGRVVVAGMFAFGLLVVSGFWTYWAVYDRPLAPLRRAIQADLPDHYVQIAAGRARESDVEELRIVIQTPYDPLAVEAAPRRDALVGSVLGEAAGWAGVAAFDRVEVVLYEEIGESADDYFYLARDVATLGDDAD